MILKFRKPMARAVAFLVIGLLGTSARADLVIRLSKDNFATFSVPAGGDNPSDQGPSSVSTTFNGVVISALDGSSNSPGSTPLGELLSSTLNLKNNTSTAKTIYISIGAQNFTAPTAPPGFVSVNSHVGGSYSGVVSIGFRSWIDQTNTQNGLAGFSTAGNQVPVLALGSFQNDAFFNISTLASGYSITEYLKVTLNGGASVNFGARTDLTSVPEPSSMVLGGIGALGMIGYGLRRRKALGV